jgi:hypothetical protein
LTLFLDPRSSSYGVGCSIIIVRLDPVGFLPFADEESNGDDLVNDISCSNDIDAFFGSAAWAYGVGCSIIIVRPMTVEFLPFVDEKINGNDSVNDNCSDDIDLLQFSIVVHNGRIIVHNGRIVVEFK